MGNHTAGDTWLDSVSSSDGDTGSRLVIWDQLVIWDHVSQDQGPYQLQITISQKKVIRFWIDHSVICDM